MLKLSKKVKIKVNSDLPSLFQEQEKLEKEKSEATHFFFTWDDITFEKDCIKLNPAKYKNIFPAITFKGSLTSLNQIKKEYFERLHPKPIKLFFKNNIFAEKISNDWHRIVNLIEPAHEYFKFRFDRSSRHTKLLNTEKLTSEQILQLFNKEVSKTAYLKYLATLQSSKHKIVPVIEYLNGALEDSFIFKIKSGSGRFLIVWENTNPSRAAHFFISKEHELESKINIIESFVMNDVGNKRSLLHDWDMEARKIKAEIFYIGSINHKSFSYFKTEVETILNRY